MKITKKQLKQLIQEQLSLDNSGEYFKYGVRKELAYIFESYMKRKGFAPDDRNDARRAGMTQNHINFTWSNIHPTKPAPDIVFSQLAKKIAGFWSYIRLDFGHSDYLYWFDADDEEKTKTDTTDFNF